MNLAFSFVVFAILVVSVSSQSSDVPVKRYVVDLDAAPRTRWVAIATEYKPQIRAAIDFIKTLVPAKDILIPVATTIGNDIENYLPQPYADEIRGVSDATGIPLGEIVLTNVVYDLSAFCTSIVYESTRGEIGHARNLDYWPLTPVLRNMTIEVDFQTGGKTSFLATTFAGYTGLLTGSRPGVFSVSINERQRGMWIENAAQALLNKEAVPLSFLIRDVLANSSITFEAAVQEYARAQLIAPVYIIVSGVKSGEGAVVTRDRHFPLDVWRLSSPSQWYLVQTNYDHWTTPPPSDDRVDPAIKGLNLIGQNNISLDGLYQILSGPPILNYGTAYTTVMSAKNSTLYKTMVRFTPPPSDE